MSDDNLPALAEVDTEIAAIETDMRVDRAGYNRDEGKQARLRTLYGARAGYRDSEPTVLTGDESPIKILDRQAYLQEQPEGDYGAYLTGMRHYGDVLVNIPVAEHQAFNALCEELPDPVAYPMIAEMQSRSTASPAEVSDERFASVAATPEGTTLVSEWGHDARRRFGVILARFLRAIDQMPEGGRGDVEVWLAKLTPVWREAVYRKLAA